MTLQLMSAYGQEDCVECPIPTDLTFTAIGDNSYEYSFTNPIFLCVRTLVVQATTTYCDGTTVPEDFTISAGSTGLITGTIPLSNTGQAIDEVSFEYFTICWTGGFCGEIGFNYCPLSSEYEIISDAGACEPGCEEPSPELICLDGEICLLVDGIPIDWNPDYYLNGGQPSCIPGNWVNAGDVLSFDIVCAADPSQNWLVDLTVPECLTGCQEPFSELVCVDGEICLFVDELPIEENPSYYLNGGQPSCIPGNWANTGDLLPYDIVCAVDPTQNWLVDLPAPECEPCGPAPNVSLVCSPGKSFCIAIDGIPVNQFPDYKAKVIDIPTNNGCVNTGVAIPPVDTPVQVEIIERFGCTWIVTVFVPDCLKGRSLRSAEEGLIGDSDFSIYPNPAVDHVSINLSEYSGESGTITIYNSLGQVVLSKQIEEISTTPVYIPLEQVKFGIHVISVKIGNKKIISRKLMINI